MLIQLVVMSATRIWPLPSVQFALVAVNVHERAVLEVCRDKFGPNSCWC